MKHLIDDATQTIPLVTITTTEAAPHRDHQNTDLEELEDYWFFPKYVYNEKRLNKEDCFCFVFLDIKTSSFLDIQRDFLDPLFCIC